MTVKGAGWKQNLPEWTCQRTLAALVGGVHGGLVSFQNIQLVADGCCNLQKQIQIAQLFGVPVIVALNVFK